MLIYSSLLSAPGNAFEGELLSLDCDDAKEVLRPAALYVSTGSRFFVMLTVLSLAISIVIRQALNHWSALQ